VPNGAVYRSGNLLSFEAVSLNAGAVPVVTRDAMHVAAYIGDTTGNGAYSALDAQRV